MTEHQHDIQHVDPTAWGWQPMSSMPDSARGLRRMGDAVQPAMPAPAPQFSEARRTSPARAASTESDVAVPFLQAAVSCGVVVLASLPVTIAAGWPWYVVPVAGGVTFAVAWFRLLSDHRSLLRVVEVIINKDLDNDQHIGKQEWRVTGEIRQEHKDRPASTSLFDLPCPSPEDLRAFARGILAGRVSFSETSAARYHYGPVMWEALRDDFINREWAYWKHPTARQQGLALTEDGQAIIAMIADTPLP